MHAYHQVFVAVGVIDAIALALTLYIVYVLLKLNKLLGMRSLMLVFVGYMVFSIGLGLSIASSMLVIFYGPSQPRGHPTLVLGAYGRGPLPGEELALRIGFTAWNILGYSSIVYAISYLLVLSGLILSRYKALGYKDVEEKSSRTSILATMTPITVLEAAQPIVQSSYLLIIGDSISLIALASIVLFHCGYLRGRLGYLLLLASHAIRLLAVIATSPWILVAAELVRPFGLILIATALVGASRK